MVKHHRPTAPCLSLDVLWDAPSCAHCMCLIDKCRCEVGMTQEQIQAVLRTLPARQRACLIMCRRDQMSYDEIARHLQIGRHDVQDAIASALVALAEANGSDR